MTAPCYMECPCGNNMAAQPECDIIETCGFHHHGTQMIMEVPGFSEILVHIYHTICLTGDFACTRYKSNTRA